MYVLQFLYKGIGQSSTRANILCKVHVKIGKAVSYYHQFGCGILKIIGHKKQDCKGTRQKSSPFIRKKAAFLSGTSNSFGPSYFETSLVTSMRLEVKKVRPC